VGKSLSHNLPDEATRVYRESGSGASRNWRNRFRESVICAPSLESTQQIQVA
jgi:hypothetical protein